MSLCVCEACDWTCWGDKDDRPHATACPECGTPFGTGVGTHARNTGVYSWVCTGWVLDDEFLGHSEPCPLHPSKGQPLMLVTNAPQAYDYDATVRTDATVSRYGVDCCIVIIPEGHFRWQLARYLSGAYVAEVW